MVLAVVSAKSIRGNCSHAVLPELSGFASKYPKTDRTPQSLEGGNAAKGNGVRLVGGQPEFNRGAQRAHFFTDIQARATQ
jgi:hypothetical protein